MTTPQTGAVVAPSQRRLVVIWSAVVATVLLVVLVVVLTGRPNTPAEGATAACQAAVADRLGVEPAAATMYVSESDAASISGWVVADGRPSAEGHDYTCHLDGAEVTRLTWDGRIVTP